MTPEIQAIVTVAVSVLGSAATAALVTRYLGAAATLGGTLSAHYVLGELGTLNVPPELHAAIEEELRTLSANPEAAGVTVEEAAQHILATVAPEFPTATFAAVVSVIGQFTRAFAAGLAGIPTPPPSPSPSPVSSVTPPGPAVSFDGSGQHYDAAGNPVPAPPAT